MSSGRPTSSQLRRIGTPVLSRLRKPRWGNLRRQHPFSEWYGYDRGRPVDRLYIERFLEQWGFEIRGDVLEVRSSVYTNRFGTGVSRSHVLDIDAENLGATIVGDLCSPETLPVAAFDCAIVTQTLQFVRQPTDALSNLWRSLRPGATLLLSVPCLARIDHELPHADFWRWTPVGLRALIEDTCPAALIRIESCGNLVAAVAFLLGLAVEDLRPSDLDIQSAAFPITACARVKKPSALGEPS